MTQTDTDTPPPQLGELGFYGLAGHTDSPADLLTECRRAEELGLGSVFLSERFNVKDAAVLSGAAAAASTTLGIATGATNHNTRHPLVTATMATTMHRMSGGRFCLGLGRGFDPLFNAIGLPPITSAALRDTVALLRRLWHGEMVLGHDDAAGKYPYLHQDATFDEDIPILLCALGEKTLELAGTCMDAVVLHTFFTDEALARCVAAVRRGEEAAGREAGSVRVWSVLATIGDHIDEELRLRKLVGRLATYLQAYGDVLLRTNQWDPAVLERFRADAVVGSVGGAIDAKADTAQLEHIATLIPDDWLAASATGTPDRCVDRVLDQYAAGADAVILHGATPDELAPIVEAYRPRRPAHLAGAAANPGR